MSFAVGVASAASLAVVLVSLVSVGMIVRDLNDLQTDVEKNMFEVKMMADDTWERMMGMPVVGSAAVPAPRATFQSVVGIRRGKLVSMQ
ncbi:unnamed protein product, partial [Mesorhabditis spiculigera]